MDIGTLSARILVDAGRFHGEMTKVRREFGAAGKDARGFGAKMDAFGKRSRAAGGLLTKGVTLPLVAFAAAGVKAAADVESANAQTVAALKSTGSAAGVSARQIRKHAEAPSALSGEDDLAIQKGENLLLTFTSIQDKAGKGNDIFSQATKTMLDMSVALGQDTKSSALQLGKALNNPVKGVTALQRVGVSFTEQQKDQIKALVKSGRTMDAQKLILRELNKEFGGSAAAKGKTFAGQMNKLKESLEDVGIVVGTALMPHLKSFVGWVQKIATGFQKLSPGTQKFLLIAAGLAAVLGPLLMVIGSIASGVAALGAVFGAIGAAAGVALGPFLLIAAAIAAVGVAIFLLIKHRKAVGEFFRKIGTAIMHALGPVVAAAKKLGALVWKAIVGYFKLILFPWKLLWQGIQKAAGILGPAAKALGGAVWKALKGAFAVMTFPARMLFRLIKGAGGLLGKAAHALGGGIVKRLWDGMKALAGWLRDKLYDLVVKPIEGVAKKLHIPLPDLGLGGGKKGGSSSGKSHGKHHAASSSASSSAGGKGGGIVIQNIFKGDVSEERVVALMSSALRRYA